jgi:hypothetical protein
MPASDVIHRKCAVPACRASWQGGRQCLCTIHMESMTPSFRREVKAILDQPDPDGSQRAEVMDRCLVEITSLSNFAHLN